MSGLIIFPEHKSPGLIARRVRKAVFEHESTESALVSLIERKANDLLRLGVDRVVIANELRAFEVALRLEVWRQTAEFGGAA